MLLLTIYLLHHATHVLNVQLYKLLSYQDKETISLEEGICWGDREEA